MVPASRRHQAMTRPEVSRQQERLLQQSSLLRQRLLNDAMSLRGPMAAADLAYTGFHWLYRHPVWPLGALAFWLALRPRRLLRLAGRTWWVYRLVKKWQQWSSVLPRFL